MAKLFVSYSRKDSVATRKLFEAFKSIDQQVWWIGNPSHQRWTGSNRSFAALKKQMDSSFASVLASTDSTGLINVWEYQDSNFTQLNSLVTEQTVSLSFNSNGTLLAVGTAKNMFLMDTQTGEEVARIPHIHVVNGVSCSADGMTLATASSKVV